MPWPSRDRLAQPSPAPHPHVPDSEYHTAHPGHVPFIAFSLHDPFAEPRIPVPILPYNQTHTLRPDSKLALCLGRNSAADGQPKPWYMSANTSYARFSTLSVCHLGSVGYSCERTTEYRKTRVRLSIVPRSPSVQWPTSHSHALERSMQ